MTDTASRPRATIFFFDGWISISVSVMGAATELLAHGYDVDLFLNSPPNDLPPPQLPVGITLHECMPWTRRVTRPVLNRMRRKKLEQISKVQANIAVRRNSAMLRAMVKAFMGFLEIPQFALYCRKRVKPTDLAIAFDMNSLAAMDFSLPRSVPFIYWSLEIWQLADLKDSFSRWMKRRELKRLPEARAVVVQSKIRLAIIEEDLPQPLGNYVEVPNAPAQSAPANLRKDFYRSRFPISQNAKVVLHSGFISMSLMSLEIAQTAPSWPTGFVLVFHERQHRDPDEPYIEAVQRAGSPRTFMSLDPVPFEEVDNVYAGADFGIVCYQTIEANEATAWASSGKLVYYLRHGLPIIVVMPQCPSILSEWRCGEWVANFEEIGPALTVIAADYENYSARARQAYAALFDFHAAFERLMIAVGKKG